MRGYCPIERLMGLAPSELGTPTVAPATVGVSSSERVSRSERVSSSGRTGSEAGGTWCAGRGARDVVRGTWEGRRC